MAESGVTGDHSSADEVLVEYRDSKRVFRLSKTLCEDISAYLKRLGVNGKVFLNAEADSVYIPFALQQWE